MIRCRNTHVASAVGWQSSSWHTDLQVCLPLSSGCNGRFATTPPFLLKYNKYNKYDGTASSISTQITTNPLAITLALLLSCSPVQKACLLLATAFHLQQRRVQGDKASRAGGWAPFRPPALPPQPPLPLEVEAANASGCATSRTGAQPQEASWVRRESNDRNAAALGSEGVSEEGGKKWIRGWDN